MSRKKVLIDGYNVIKAAPGRFARMTDLAAQRSHLLRLLQSSAVWQGSVVVVIFDGSSGLQSPHRSYRNIQVIYSGKKKEADDIIQESIRKEAHQAALLVISSDRRILNTARDHGARAMTSRQFWQEMDTPGKKYSPRPSQESDPERPLSKKEIAEWHKLFTERDNNADEN